ncbi:MAG: alanine racemase [Bdellovibrio sp.]|nr:MAG: alanine racemase [Bdellovibrio sp.]
MKISPLRPSAAHIHLDHLVHNLRTLRALAPADFFCPMIKANAYGHGAISVAKTLQSHGVSSLGVSLIEEGLQLRENGIAGEILLFGLFTQGAQAVVDAQLTPVLSSWEQAHALIETRTPSPLAVHVKIDTGMHRLGFAVSDVSRLLEFFAENRQLNPVGLLTHLLHSEDAADADGETARQILQFEPVVEAFRSYSPQVHVWNTGGLLLGPKQKFPEWGARPGIGVYGVSPSPKVHSGSLKAVMSFRSRICKLNSLSPGESVSYSSTWKAQRKSLIGVVPLGYADGIHRVSSNVGFMMVEGEKVPIVGNVCMDYVMVDLTDMKHKGDHLLDAEVTVFGYDSQGREFSVAEVAAASQTSPYEILTSVSARVPRIFQSEQP